MSETIGQRLKQEREGRYLTLEKASEDTRIRKVFLQALESDDYSVMLSAAQGRGFLRNYAVYLELNIDEMIAEIQKNAPSTEVSGPLPQVNLVETEIPPLVTQDEKPAPRFWDRWLGHRPKEESAAEAESKPAPAPVIEPLAPQFIPTLPADMIFAEIGQQLRARREMRAATPRMRS